MGLEGVFNTMVVGFFFWFFWQRPCTATCSTTRWSTSSLPSAGWTTSWWGSCHYAAQSDCGTPTRYAHTHSHTCVDATCVKSTANEYVITMFDEIWMDRSNVVENFSQGTDPKCNFFFFLWAGLFNHLDFLLSFRRKNFKKCVRSSTAKGLICELHILPTMVLFKLLEAKYLIIALKKSPQSFVSP